MQAIVQAIDTNAVKGSYSGVSITLKQDGQPPKEYFVFGNSPIAKEIKAVSVGDTVEARMTKNGKYWNLGGVTRTATKAATPEVKTSSTPTAKSSSGTGWQPRFSDSEEYVRRRDASIARQSSVKAAIELVTSMLTQGIYKKTVTDEFIWQQVQKYTKSIESYVTLTDTDSMIESSIEDLEVGAYEEGDDDPFPG